MTSQPTSPQTRDSAVTVVDDDDRRRVTARRRARRRSASSIPSGASYVSTTTAVTTPEATGPTLGTAAKAATSVGACLERSTSPGNAESDALLNEDGTALLIGMLLDQQVPMEWAFAGPATLRARLGHLDARRIAEMDREEFVAVCCAKPSIHRFPASMGRRIHDLCAALVERVRRHG